MDFKDDLEIKEDGKVEKWLFWGGLQEGKSVFVSLVVISGEKKRILAEKH